MPNSTLRITTFNIHKGVTGFNAHFALRDQRSLIRYLRSDIVFLQEVQQEHALYSRRFQHWPVEGQAEYLAGRYWSDYAYGKNSVYPGGHHGNALLSRFPITKSANLNISAHSLEQRGMLHCEMNIPQWDTPLHCICVHLGLFSKWRKKQVRLLRERIAAEVPADAPLIIAGDFNDWGMSAGELLTPGLRLHEAFEHRAGKSARSFPSIMPFLRLDRIYTRGFDIEHVEVHSGPRLAAISDHAALSATLTRVPDASRSSAR